MDDFEKVFAKALRFLSYRQRSEKEVRDNLQKSKKSRVQVEEVDKEVLDRVIETLKKQKFINDEEFARMWVESRARAKPRATRVIKMELKQKGISDSIIDATLQSSDVKVASDKEMAKKLVEKKMARYKNYTDEEKRNKLGQLLASKGFNWDTIKEVISQVESLK